MDRQESPHFKHALTPALVPKILRGGTGKITTENFPGNVPQNRVCLWEIEIPQGFVLDCWFDGKISKQFLRNDIPLKIPLFQSSVSDIPLKVPRASI